MFLLHCTWFYIILPWLCFTLLYSTLHYPDCTLHSQYSTSPYIILHYSTMALLLLCLTLHYSTMPLLRSSWLYITLPSLYFTLLDSRLLYYGSTSLDLTLHYSTVALLHSMWLHYSTVVQLQSTWLYITLPWLYFTLLDCTLLYHGSTSVYFTLYHGSTSVYFTLATLVYS